MAKEQRFVFTREIFAKSEKEARRIMDELMWAEVRASERPEMTFFKVHQHNGTGCGLCCLTCDLMDKYCKKLFKKPQGAK